MRSSGVSPWCHHDAVKRGGGMNRMHPVRTAGESHVDPGMWTCDGSDRAIAWSPFSVGHAQRGDERRRRSCGNQTAGFGRLETERVMMIGSGSAIVLPHGLPVPGKEFVQPALRRLGDAAENTRNSRSRSSTGPRWSSVRRASCGRTGWSFRQVGLVILPRRWQQRLERGRLRDRIPFQ